MSGILPSAEELAKMTEADRARVMSQLNAATGGTIPGASAYARAAAGELSESGPANTARELAAGQLAAASIPLKAAVPFGVGPYQVMGAAEAAGLIRKAQAPAPDPDVPAEAAEEPPFRMYSEQMPDAAHKAEKGAGGGRAGPFQIGTDQRSGHILLGRPVPKEAKDAWDTAVKHRGDAVDIAERGVEAEGAARDAFFVRREREMAEQQQRAEALAKQKQEALKALDDRVQSRLDEERSPGAIANRTVSRVMSGIGMALGAYAATIRGGPNHAFEIYKQHINEEAAALERQSRHEDNLYARMYRSFGDKEQALAATRAALHDRGALELAKIESTTKTAHGKAAAADMRAKNAMELGNQRDHIASVEAKKEEVTQAQSRGVFAGGPTDPLGMQAPAGVRQASPGPDPKEALAAPVAAREEAGAAVARPKLGGWFPTSEQMDVAAHPDGPAPPAQVFSSAPRAPAPPRAPEPAAAPPAQAAAPRTAAQERMLKRAELAQLARTNPKLITAAQEQLREHAQKNGKDIEALEGAIAFEKSWPTGKALANNEGLLGTATVKAVDALEAVANDEKAGLVKRMAAREAAAAAINTLSPEDRARYVAWKAIRASFIRANAGATLSPSEKEMYDGLVGSYDVRRMMEFYQVHLKPKIAAKWNADSLGLSREANLMREIHGVPTEVKPNAPWSSYTARTQ